MNRGNAWGAKGPWFKVNAGSGESWEIGVSLSTPQKVQKLQSALHAKAKGSPDYRLRRWLGELTEAYQAVDAHARYRLRQWLCCKHKVPGAGTSRFPDEFLHETLGLVRLALRTRNFPWAKA